jgi:hypothetical protein
MIQNFKLLIYIIPSSYDENNYKSLSTRQLQDLPIIYNV